MFSQNRIAQNEKKGRRQNQKSIKIALFFFFHISDGGNDDNSETALR